MAIVIKLSFRQSPMILTKLSSQPDYVLLHLPPLWNAGDRKDRDEAMVHGPGMAEGHDKRRATTVRSPRDRGLSICVSASCRALG